MKAGYAIREITPAKSYPMAGFDLRKETAAGVHDPLCVRALAWEESEKKLIIVYDLLGVPADMVRSLREKLEVALGIGRDAVQVCGTHTHAAPNSIFLNADSFDRMYREHVENLGVEAAIEAVSAAEPARVDVLEGTVENVGSFRDEKREDSAFSMPCDVIRFSFEDAAPILLLTCHCHPTVLNEKNLLNTADLFYGCDKKLREMLPDVRTIFLNGACGDISTRYTRRASDFAEVERLGAVWAEKVLSMLREQGESAEDAFPVFGKGAELYIPPADFFTEEQRREIVAYLDDKIERCPDAEQKREYVSCRSVLMRRYYGINRDGSPLQGKTVWLNATGIGRALLIFIPFEYSQRDAVLLKREVMQRLRSIPDAEHMTVEIIGYGNGYEGYLPSGRPLDRDSGYMDVCSNFNSSAKRLLAQKTLELLT